MRVGEGVLSFIVLLVASGAAAADGNLLANGDFATASQLAGWTCSGNGPAVWTSDDADALATSGSLEMTVSSVYLPPLNMWLPGGANCIASCIGVRPGAAYLFGGQSRLVNGSTAPPLAIFFSCFSYPQSACTGSPTPLATPLLSTLPDWNGTPVMADGTLGADAVSVQCQAAANTFDGLTAATGTAHFDNLFFETDVVFADGFE